MKNRITEGLHHFVDYIFDFSQVRHADTVYRIMEYIKSNDQNTIGLDEVAAYVHLSNSHVFKKQTGLSPKKFRQQANSRE